MPDALIPSTGWGVLHLFCTVTPAFDAEAVVAATKAVEADGYQAIPFAVLGHKADIGFMALGPDLWRLQQFQTELQRAGLAVATSYVSLTEVSEYAKGMPEQMLQARLYPNLPPDGMRAFCWYPMSKRRGETDNWFSLPYDERSELMHGHGKTGRTFAGRVLQVITGSAGLDDWEWAVSLFAVNPDDLKEVVYTMRFDEASAKYAEFGPFITGLISTVEEVVARVAR
ncbi:MAG TPA: chlorite dismutase family protein [Acidimicrobiales bacterium]|nr:chlorite dismutase family protein [Acidimicrobiales bacterium]